MSSTYTVELHNSTSYPSADNETLLVDVSFDREVLLKEIWAKVFTGSSGIVYVRVYDQNGNRIGSGGPYNIANVAGWTPSLALSSPITLSAGVRYSIGIYAPSGSGVGFNRFNPGVSFPHVHDSTPQGISVTVYSFRYGTGDVYPTSTSTTTEGGFRFGVDTANTAPNAPINLSVSDGNAQPRLSWTFSDPNAGDTQSKFRVQVERFDGSSWVFHHDSGEVTSSNTYYDIPYSARLSPNTQYRFRVMVWDSQGAASPWSDYYTWTTNKPYVSTGTWVSEPIYVGREGGVLNGTLSWNALTPPLTSVTCEYRTSSDGDTWTNWTPIANGGAVPPANYVQFRFTLTTNDEFATPELQDVTISYPSEYVPSGTWETDQPISLQNAQGEVGLSWGELKPTGTNVLVETSIDGGVTWLPATNGGSVPGITPGTDLTGVNLKVRVTLTTSDPSSTPSIYNLSVLSGSSTPKPPLRLSSKEDVTFNLAGSLSGWSPRGAVYASFSRSSDAYTLDGEKVYPSDTSPITGLGVHKSDSLLAVVGGEMRKVDLNGNVGSPLLSGLSKTSRWSFVNFEGNFPDVNLLAADGNRVLRFDGSSVSDLPDVTFQFKYLATHANRVFGAVGRALAFSALRKATDWTTADDAGIIYIEPEDGSFITGVKSGLDKPLIFCRNNTYELYGTSPANFRLVLVSSQIGCVSNNTAVVLHGVMRWLGADGIYEYKGGTPPSRDFALPVQEYVDRITKGYEERACAATDGKRYYLALPIDGSTEPNIILEYDPTFGTWMAWHPVSRVLCLAAVKETIYAGTEDGRILKFDPDATADDGEAIPWVWESPPIGSGSYITKKRWYDMWLVVDLPMGSSLDVYLSPKPEGEDSWTMVRSLTASSDMQSVRVILPVQTIANANWVRVRLVGTGPAKVHELAYRERILPL